MQNFKHVSGLYSDTIISLLWPICATIAAIFANYAYSCVTETSLDSQTHYPIWEWRCFLRFRTLTHAALAR